MPLDSTNPVFPKSSESDVIFDHAQRLSAPAAAPEGWNGAPVLLVPKGWTPVPVPGWQPSSPPDHISASILMEDGESFARYVSAFKTNDSQVFASRGDDGKLFVDAVLDFHSINGATAFCRHRVRWSPKNSVAWMRWTGVDRRPFTQAEFSQFLEDNMFDIHMPTGGDLLGIINALEIDGLLVFQKVIRLQDGTVKFTFQNEQRAKSGEISVPQQFHLSLPVFEGEPGLVVVARLRYRLSSAGELKVWFELVAPDKAVDAAVQFVVDRIYKGCGILPFRGRAPI